MNLLVINGSPRDKKHSNTDKILNAFLKGFCEQGNTAQRYEISDRNQWKKAAEEFAEYKNVLIALPLFVECVPGNLLEFLETLTPKNDGTKIAFILQGGFSEGCQLRCGEEYLKMLPGYLGCEYNGTLVKGDNFGIRLMTEEEAGKVTDPYIEMGRVFAREGSFFGEESRKFTGYEVLPMPQRLLYGLIFRTFAKKYFEKAAAGWGCTQPLDARPYQK